VGSCVPEWISSSLKATGEAEQGQEAAEISAGRGSSVRDCVLVAPVDSDSSSSPSTDFGTVEGRSPNKDRMFIL
jgi:hypothetical protein